VEYPLGHKRRRAEGVPLLFAKLREDLSGRLSTERVEQIVTLFRDRKRLEGMTVPQLIDLFL